MTLEIPKLVKVSEVSDALRVSSTTVVRWIKEGKLIGYQFGEGGDYRINLEDLQERLNNLKVETING